MKRPGEPLDPLDELREAALEGLSGRTGEMARAALEAQGALTPAAPPEPATAATAPDGASSGAAAAGDVAPASGTLRDISVLVHPGTPEWPGDTPFSCGWTWEMARGASVNVSSIAMSPHVGTHADAPLHVRDGWPASHELPVEAFVGRAVVLGVEGPPGDLRLDDIAARLPRGVERLLLRTGASIAFGTFPDDWPALDEACARALGASGLRLLGVDAPSVDRKESKVLSVHRALFEGGAQVLENLDLRGIEDGEYELVALPLKTHGLDAAPVRAVLRRA